MYSRVHFELNQNILSICKKKALQWESITAFAIKTVEFEIDLFKVNVSFWIGSNSKSYHTTYHMTPHYSRKSIDFDAGNIELSIHLFLVFVAYFHISSSFFESHFLLWQIFIQVNFKPSHLFCWGRLWTDKHWFHFIIEVKLNKKKCDNQFLGNLPIKTELINPHFFRRVFCMQPMIIEPVKRNNSKSWLSH